MYLNDLNPSVKALTIAGLVFILAFLFDPITPFLYLIFVISVTFLFGRFNKKHYLLYFSPFFIFAFGMLWTTLAFADAPSNPEQIMAILWWEFPREDLLIAVSLSLRVLAFAVLSLLFIFTTDMVHFVLSLIQQLKLSPKLAYGVLAGYRFLPMLKTEFQLIRAAHRVRGVSQAKTIQGKVGQWKRFAIPLLAGAIRKAERTAVAMESKGFTGNRNRTYFHQFTVTKKDWLFPIFMFTGLGLVILVSVKLGYFNIYDGEL
ncbi:energy-coupling factor transporter transmembrane component T family protein [Halobacillus yeomjeoni]|uniref:Energy-coupling factor transporter transmembrane protein EcfT n=1 Tax=Halobacillus yeomjeoni TaxID=311194 RepID=A0A931HV43_9BACI|nr:energy-coupling factor transporter transmembrane component T [Halobacillus yeomjeoni]MBH0229706.1 energy-coupling factor transporter transmembrane protein EcfT [Halobacillus yeomjeoni]